VLGEIVDQLLQGIALILACYYYYCGDMQKSIVWVLLAILNILLSFKKEW
jgi:hypothetical protein